MSESKKINDLKGSCLCGSVKVHATEVSHDLGVCHCGMCRKQNGGPLFAVDCGQSVKFEGEEFIQVYSSSDWAERGFCKKCGSGLFYRLKQTGQHIMSAGLFDVEFNFHHQIFIDEKPKYYDFQNQTETMTGAEVFAKFS